MEIVLKNLGKLWIQLLSTIEIVLTPAGTISTELWVNTEFTPHSKFTASTFFTAEGPFGIP